MCSMGIINGQYPFGYILGESNHGAGVAPEVDYPNPYAHNRTN